MSIFDKSFIQSITNDNIPEFTHFQQYDTYLKTNVQKILSATLLSHIFEGSGSDVHAYLLYKYEDKYIFISIWEGTCSGCKFGDITYNSIIETALEKCYVSTNLEDIEKYYLQCLSNVEMDTEYRKKEDLYNIYPNTVYNKHWT